MKSTEKSKAAYRPRTDNIQFTKPIQTFTIPGESVESSGIVADTSADADAIDVGVVQRVYPGGCTESEEWREIPGFNNYEVSSAGRVRSILNQSIVRDHILKPQLNDKGYQRVMLRCDGKNKFARVARLVAAAFIPNPSNKSQVNHINGVKADDRASNLEWTTPQENIDHALGTGLSIQAGESNPGAKLTLESVELIRQKIARRVPFKHIASEFGVSETAIRSISNGRTWKPSAPTLSESGAER